MFQIDHPSAVAVEPARTAAGDPGYFSGGVPNDPLNPPTVVTAEFLNIIQNEMLSVIAAAGLVPNKADDTQFGQAVSILAGSVPTGSVLGTIKTAEPAGWLFMDGRTIGKTGSGANLQSDFYGALYADLYGLDDLYTPVIGGRSGDATADFNAGKPITLLEATGRALIAAGLGTGLTIDHPLGSKIGEEGHAQTESEVGTHDHAFQRHGPNVATGGAGAQKPDAGLETKNTSTAGGGVPFNIIQPSLALNVMIKI